VEFILLYVIIGLLGYTSVRVSLKPRATQEAIEEKSMPLALVSGHTLIRVWDNRDVDYEDQGFWFECSCGMKRPADGTNSKEFGSETDAIRSFKIHVKLHEGLPSEEDNPWKIKYEEAVDHLDKFRNACYCKDANNDIILLEIERKK